MECDFIGLKLDGRVTYINLHYVVRVSEGTGGADAEVWLSTGERLEFNGTGGPALLNFLAEHCVRP